MNTTITPYRFKDGWGVCITEAPESAPFVMGNYVIAKAKNGKQFHEILVKKEWQRDRPKLRQGWSTRPATDDERRKLTARNPSGKLQEPPEPTAPEPVSPEGRRSPRPPQPSPQPSEAPKPSQPAASTKELAENEWLPALQQAWRQGYQQALHDIGGMVDELSPPDAPHMPAPKAPAESERPAAITPWEAGMEPSSNGSNGSKPEAPEDTEVIPYSCVCGETFTSRGDQQHHIWNCPSVGEKPEPAAPAPAPKPQPEPAPEPIEASFPKSSEPVPW